MKIGDRVEYIHIDTGYDKETGFYPPIGTYGTVVDIDKTGIRVKWDSGTKYEGIWWCTYEDVEEIQDDKPNELIDKIASFFETEENWKALKKCWLEDGRSEDLRSLLYKAIKE